MADLSDQPSATTPDTTPTFDGGITDEAKARLTEASARARQRCGFTDEPPIPAVPVREILPMPPAHVVAPRVPMDEEIEAHRRTEELRRKQRDASDNWSRLRRQIGERYAACRIATFRMTDESRQKPILDALTDYATYMPERVAAGVNLLWLGPPGTGKDHLAAALMRAAVLAHYLSVEWINGMDWFGRVRDAMDTDERERDIIGELVRPDVLCLSDPVPPLGELTDFQRGMLYRVIDGRYRNLRPTWVTANLSDRADAERRLGPQSYDRLRDGGLVLWCNWPSYRQVQQAVNANSQSKAATK